MSNALYVFRCIECRCQISLITQEPVTFRDLHVLLLEREWLPIDLQKKMVQCKDCQQRVMKVAVDEVKQ